MPETLTIAQVTAHRLDAHDFEKLVSDSLLNGELQADCDVSGVAGGADDPSICAARFYDDITKPSSVEEQATMAADVEAVLAGLREGHELAYSIQACVTICESGYVATMLLLSQLVNDDVLPEGSYVIEYQT